jgi:hypothetical protein
LQTANKSLASRESSHQFLSDSHCPLHAALTSEVAFWKAALREQAGRQSLLEVALIEAVTGAAAVAMTHEREAAATAAAVAMAHEREAAATAVAHERETAVAASAHERDTAAAAVAHERQMAAAAAAHEKEMAMTTATHEKETGMASSRRTTVDQVL